MERDGKARLSSREDDLAESLDTCAGTFTRGPAAPSGEYRVPTTEFLQKVLDAEQQGENPLFFSSVAWELGHDIDKQEYALAAECFRRLLGSAASAADRFLIEAARVAGQLCGELSRGRLVGKELQEACETLRKDLTYLSHEE